MDPDGEEPAPKRRRYEQSSTPIRELDPLQPPHCIELSPLKESEGEGRENGLDHIVAVEEPIGPAPTVAESDTEPAQGPGLDDTVLLDDNDQGPDDLGLSDEAMESFITEVEEEQQLGERPLPQWAKLPNELWQQIFQRVPLLDLVTSGRGVCQRWNQIIADEKFLHWKKTYYRFKCWDPDTLSVVETILYPPEFSLAAHPQQNGQLFTHGGSLIDTNPNFTLVYLARLFAEQFSNFSVDMEGVLSMMSKHPQYNCVSKIKEQIPDLNVLARLLLLVTCCTSVHQVLLLMELLLRPMSGGFSQPALAYNEMSEMFHAMATFFLSHCNKGTLPPRFHYNVFYSLDVIHRSSFVPPLCHQPLLSDDPPSVSSFNCSNGCFPTSSPSCSLPSTDVSFSSSQGSQVGEASSLSSSQCGTFCESGDVLLTSEQARVVTYPIQKGETIKVIAFAGTGKTTTLVQFAKRNRHLSIGYCVYNRSVRNHAHSVVFKDIKHVKCRTFHSLACKSIGVSYTAKTTLLNKFPNMTTYSVSKLIDIDKVPSMTGLNKKQGLYSFSKYIKGTLENFWASADREIKSKHIPRFRHSNPVRRITDTLNYLAEAEDTECEGNVVEPVDENCVWRILEESRKIWNKMKNQMDKSVLMTHDGYLKLFQLSGVNFADCAYRHWDVVLIDEAQDLSPAIVDLVKKATSCAKIIVGDPHQQIYSFRGATNAIPMLEADRTFFLTRSFRFGPEIAYVSSVILRRLKQVKEKTLVGTTDTGCVYGTGDFRQVAIIARTNAGLFEEMARVIRSPGGEKKRLGFVGELENYNLNHLESVYLLFQGNVTEAKKRKHYKQFTSFHELQQYAEHSCDFQLQREIRICQRHSDVLHIIKQIHKQAVKELCFADVIFSTAHKSKGLEFDNVRLADDFLPNFDFTRHSLGLSSARLPDDDRNLLYVAASRAKCQLCLSPTCISVLQTVQEYFVYPMVVQEAVSAAEDECIICHTPFSDSCQQPQLKLFRPAIRQSTGVSTICQREGFLCKYCGFRTLPSFSFTF